MPHSLAGHESASTPWHNARGRGWPRWTPYAAVIWSLAYAALSGYWAVSGRGFPYSAPRESGAITAGVSRLGPVGAALVVAAVGLPAAALGVLMLRGTRSFRVGLIAAGGLLAAGLLLLMTDLNLLIMLGYVPYIVAHLFSGAAIVHNYLQGLTEWTWLHQWVCVLGGFLWLGATVSYSRRSGEACLECGRRAGPEGWTSPTRAARWGRWAVGVALVAPGYYAATRYAWALGIPWGMSPTALRAGQEAGTWVSGLFLATFGLVGGLLMLGLVQRWGEVFPRWMPGLAGRRVPIALAVVPAAVVAVLLTVGGITMWASYGSMAAAAAATDQALWVLVGPLLLFPVWGVALAAAALAYYLRRRGPCPACGRGAPPEA
jgi:hypothetical protein